MTVPRVRWAKAGRLNIAYTVSGEGPRDLVFAMNWFSNVELIWDMPSSARFLDSLGRFTRLVLFDRRGTGLSDPVSLDEVPTLDDRVEDLVAVMDAVGVEHAALMASGAGSYLAIYAAATLPDRVDSLVVIDGTARMGRAPDYPIGIPADVSDRFIETTRSRWGDADGQAALGWEDDPEGGARYQRQSAPLGRVEAEQRFLFDMDVREVLPAVHVPTLVIHHRDNTQVRVASGRFVADHIEGARFVELEGRSVLWAEDGDRILALVEEHLTGERNVGPVDTAVATVLYTDIVDSTARSAGQGDRAWRRTLDNHEATVRRELARHNGREIKTMGDGFLVTFNSTQRAIACAQAIVASGPMLGIEVRAGLHTGEIELRGDDIGGIAVAIGARVIAHADPGEVLISGTVKDLVLGAALNFEARGEHELKGVPGTWPLWSVVPTRRRHDSRH